MLLHSCHSFYNLRTVKPTRKHIADKALLLFNEKGFVNVRLQHIADAAFVSVGHLAYHFKNKETIVENLYDELQAKQEELLSEYRVVPLFEDINRYLVADFRQQCTYIFFYVDTLEILRAYPEILQKHSLHIQWQLAQLKMMLSFNCSRGSLMALPDPELDHLAWQLRSLIDMWLYLKKVEGKNETGLPFFLSDIWGILSPFFTDMGRREYEQLNNER